MKRTIFALVSVLCVALGQCSPAHAGQEGTSRMSKYALYSAAAVAVAGASWFVYRKFVKPYFSGGADNADDARSESGDSNAANDLRVPDLAPEADAARESVASVEAVQQAPVVEQEPAVTQEERVASKKPASPTVGIADVAAIRARMYRRRRAHDVSNVRIQVPAQSPQKDNRGSMWSGLDLDEDEEKSPEPAIAPSPVAQERPTGLSAADRRIFEDVKRRHRIFFPNAQQTQDELMAFSTYYHSLAISFEKVFSRYSHEDEVRDFSRQFEAFRREAGGQRETLLGRFERCYSEFRAYRENNERPTTQQLMGLDRLFARFEQTMRRVPREDELFQFHQYREVRSHYPHNEANLLTFIAAQ